MREEKIIMVSAFVGAIVSIILTRAVEVIITSRDILYIIISFIVWVGVFCLLYVFTLKNFGIEVERY